jgi:hypothetical protein
MEFFLISSRAARLSHPVLLDFITLRILAKSKNYGTLWILRLIACLLLNTVLYSCF